MSSNDLYSFDFDTDGNITQVYEVSSSGALSVEDIDRDETYALVDGYVILTEAERGRSEFTVFKQDATTGYWFEIAEGRGTLDSAGLAAIIEAAADLTAPAGETDDDSSDDDADDSSDDDDSDDHGHHGDGDVYQITLDEAGTSVVSIYEVEDDGSLEIEPISPNETYTVSGDYVIEVETKRGGTEWSVYQLDSTTGYYTEIAEGHGTPDLTDIDALIAGYTPGDYTRVDDDDYYVGSNDDDAFDGEDGDDIYHGGEGHDRVVFSGSTAVHIDLDDDEAQDTGYGYDTFSSIEEVETGDADDVVTGSASANRLIGNGGRDELRGGGGEDDLRGGRGHDKLYGGADDDTLTGGAGRDRLSGDDGDDHLSGGGGRDRLFGGGGDDDLSGGAHGDMIKGGSGLDSLSGDSGNDRLFGQAGDDTLSGGDGADRIKGGSGNDSMSGDAGNDRLIGQAGDDIMDGGDGNDRLKGGSGNDTMTGGAGEDVFIFEDADGDDTITDFEIGVDLLYIDAGDETMFEELTVSAVGEDAVIDYSGGTITLTGVDAALLDADSFVFG